jgi:hypothetical protein
MLNAVGRGDGLEIGGLVRHCFDRRIPDREKLKRTNAA